MSLQTRILLVGALLVAGCAGQPDAQPETTSASAPSSVSSAADWTPLADEARLDRAEAERASETEYAKKVEGTPQTRFTQIGPGRATWVRDSVSASSGAARGWLSWRGPHQNGTSDETGLFETLEVDGENHLWSYEVRGRGTPVIADGRLYATGYSGAGPDLREMIFCLDADTGALQWKHLFTDFLSDIIYDRYAISSPVIDPETGDVFFLSSPGLLSCFSPDGDLRWQVAMQASFGRLTFPNGRTGAPVIDDDLVIIHTITSSWGKLGPARDRFYAFDKATGANVWSSTPGGPPKDSPYSYPVLAWEGDERVLYAGTGCGHVVCVNARTGDPIWRYQMSIGGVNASVVLDGDSIIAWHGRENLDTSSIGRMISIARSGPGSDSAERPSVLNASREEWRNDLGAFTSSPVLVEDRLYMTTPNGELKCVDAATGELLWHEKLASDQIHASPVYADGKLYVPMNNGSFHVVRPTDDGVERLAQVQLAGNCLGAPAVADGRVYVHTTEKLYCFGEVRPATERMMPATRLRPAAGATRLQLVPGEVLLRQGDRVDVAARSLDGNGHVVDARVSNLEWKANPRLDVFFDDARRLAVRDDAKPGAADLEATADGVAGSMRVRIVPKLPFNEDFESFDVSKPHKVETDVKFAFPPSHWIGGRLKWEVRELDGDKVLAKTLDRSLFQRATTLIGSPEMRDYTAQIDLMSDGNRRSMSSAGVINQRYLAMLKGNHQTLQVSSNDERLKESVPFRWRPKTWYRLKSRVDFISEDTAIVRAKAWPRDEPEPDAWTIEVEHRGAHRQGTPALFGFTPQSRFRVYVDNIQITPND